MSYYLDQSYRFRYSLAIALIIHGIIIFGITFNMAVKASNNQQKEVTLSLSFSDEKNDEADFLALSNQKGSGDTEKPTELTVENEALFSTNHIQKVTPIFLPDDQAPSQHSINVRVITTIGSSQYTFFSDDINDIEQQKEVPNKEKKTLSELSIQIANLEARLAEKQNNNARKPRVLTLTSASTMAADNAAYVHQWRNRVETIGNLHYPQQAREKNLYGDVRLLVKLSSNGIVEEITILSSSGSNVLDKAAIDSIRLASPFEPFPNELASKYDRIDIIRTWQFRKNRISSKSS